jgi:proteic killer suppression protein
VIKTFADKLTRALFLTGRARRLPPEILPRALRRLAQINAAASLDDLAVPPSNRLHGLDGDRKGQHSVSINDRWRVCFRFEDGDAFDVEVCDYR